MLLHAGVGAPLADRAAARVAPPRADQRNARATGARRPRRWHDQLLALYSPFVERLYAVIAARAIAVTPCDHRGTRFLDTPPPANASAAARGGAARRRGGRRGGRRWQGGQARRPAAARRADGLRRGRARPASESAGGLARFLPGFLRGR